MKKFTLIILVVFLSISLFSQDTWITYTTTDGLVNNSIKCLTIDDSNNIWIGTENGVSVFDGTDFTNYTTADGLANNSILSSYMDTDGNIWLGTMGGGVSKYDGSVFTNYSTGDGLASSMVYAVFQDDQGDMWFGTTSGVSHFDGSTWTTHSASTGMPSNIVSSINQDVSGNIWVGLWMSGVAIWDGADWTTIEEVDSLVYYQATTIFRDNNDNMWVGTTEGISMFDNTGEWVVNYRHLEDGLIDDWVQGMALDNDNNLWFAFYTDYLNNGGASMLNGSDWTNYTPADGLASINVRDVKVDSDNNIWFGTILGLNKLTIATNKVEIEMEKDEINIYPNPATNNITISGTENSSIQILDISGKVLMEKYLNATNSSIDISSLERGIYIISINHNNNIQTKKLIKN